MDANQHATATDGVGPDDAPALTDEFFQCADEFEGAKVVRRGRPKAVATKEAATLRLDAELLAALRVTGDGGQTRINDVLRASMHLVGRV